MDKIKESIKHHEGYRNKVYLDTLGKRTVGYGHLCVEDFWEDDKEYDKEFLDGIFDVDYKKAEDSAKRLFEMNGCADMDDQAKGIIIEMVFQLGPTGVSKFKMMWKCLSELNYVGASYEMIDSRWYKQTTNRAKELSNRMKNISIKDLDRSLQ